MFGSHHGIPITYSARGKADSSSPMPVAKEWARVWAQVGCGSERGSKLVFFLVVWMLTECPNYPQHVARSEFLGRYVAHSVTQPLQRSSIGINSSGSHVNGVG